MTLENDANIKQLNGIFLEVVLLIYRKHQIDERIEYLEKYIRSQCRSIELDFSVNSLIAVWDWYEKQVTVDWEDNIKRN